MMVYGVMLSLVHFILSFLEYIVIFWRSLKRRAIRFWNSPLSYGSFNGYSSKVIQQLSTRLARFPVHLAIVIVEEKLSFADLARMIVWSTALKIEYLTVYDYRGRCKRKIDELRKAVEEQTLVYLNQVNSNVMSDSKSSSVWQREIIILSPSQSLPSTNGHKQTTYVRVVAPEDGRQKIVDVTRKLVVEVANQNLSREDITVDKMDSTIREASGGWSDPELILRCGSISSLLGFLPWETRLSEIMPISSHVDVDVCEFEAALQSYTRTEQRFGK